MHHNGLHYGATTPISIAPPMLSMPDHAIIVRGLGKLFDSTCNQETSPPFKIMVKHTRSRKPHHNIYGIPELST